jgi:hypothetical protein
VWHIVLFCMSLHTETHTTNELLFSGLVVHYILEIYKFFYLLYENKIYYLIISIKYLQKHICFVVESEIVFFFNWNSQNTYQINASAVREFSRRHQIWKVSSQADLFFSNKPKKTPISHNSAVNLWSNKSVINNSVDRGKNNKNRHMVCFFLCS